MSYPDLNDLKVFIEAKGWTFGSWERLNWNKVRFCFGKGHSFFYADAEISSDKSLYPNIGEVSEALFGSAKVAIVKRMEQLVAEGAVPKESEPLKPPKGYESWLDYAIETMETRELFLEVCWGESPWPDGTQREDMRHAAKQELEKLRRRAASAS